KAHNQSIAAEEQLFKAWIVASDGVSQTGLTILRPVLRDKKLSESIKQNAVPINLLKNGILIPSALVTIDQSFADGFLKRTTRALIWKFHNEFSTPNVYFSVGMLTHPSPNNKARER